MAAMSAGCGAPEYPLQFVNDLPQAVVIEGCKGCAGGREVDPDQSVRLKVEQDIVVKVTTVGGTVVGCGYTPAGASTSDVVPTKASDFEGLLCESPAGEKRR
jgi:hypothetical protein